jgi:hypothetical protein
MRGVLLRLPQTFFLPTRQLCNTGGVRSASIGGLGENFQPNGLFRVSLERERERENTIMRYRTKDGLLIEAETSLDVVHRLREASWGEQNLGDQAFMEAVADRMYQQGIHVSTVSPDIFVAGLLIAGLLTREIEGTLS